MMEQLDMFAALPAPPPAAPTVAAVLPAYRELLRQHDRAMRAGDPEAAQLLRAQARALVATVNGGSRVGMYAGPAAPGCQIEAATAASVGVVPLWGQVGQIVVTAAGVRARLKFRTGLAGLADRGFWPGIDAYAVDGGPWLSASGFRALDPRLAIRPGLDPFRFGQLALADLVERELAGQLVPVTTKVAA